MVSKKSTRKEKKEFIHCTPVSLPAELMRESAMLAVSYNPANMPLRSSTLTPDQLAVVTSKYWQPKGVNLTVGFPFDATPVAVQNRILLHMNAWGAFSNVKFSLTNTDPQVRISRAKTGYWSYLGVDILSIPRNQATMNLQEFSATTSEQEYTRVVRHETGHTLGSPHEHLRREIIDLLDINKTIAWGRQSLGWDEQTVRSQILTPVSESSIMATPKTDKTSIMCYQLPGSITKNGQPIPGGNDIDDLDKEFMAKIYPLSVKPPPPPPPPGGDLWVLFEDTADTKTWKRSRAA